MVTDHTVAINQLTAIAAQEGIQQPADARQCCGDLLHHAIGEILLFRVAAHVLERQHDQRRLVGQRRLPPNELGGRKPLWTSSPTANLSLKVVFGASGLYRQLSHSVRGDAVIHSRGPLQSPLLTVWRGGRKGPPPVAAQTVGGRVFPVGSSLA